MDIIVTGQIVQILPVQSGVSQSTGNQWQRGSYIIEHEHGQYPRRMVFDVTGQKIQELNLQLGETVTLHLNVDCREYPQGSGKFFNTIQAWKVDRQQMQQAAPQPQYQQPAPQQFPPQVNQQGQPQYQQQYQPAPAPQPQAQQPVQGTQATTQGLPF